MSTRVLGWDYWPAEVKRDNRMAPWSRLWDHRGPRVLTAAVRVPRCKSRAGVWRYRHVPDRDGVCVFCDRAVRGQ